MSRGKRVDALRSSAADLSPSHRSTAEQRRAVLLATLGEAIELLKDPETGAAVRATCVKEIRTLIAQIGAQDSELDHPAGSWGSGPFVAE